MANGRLCGLGNFVICMNPPIVPVQLSHPACCINRLEASRNVQLPQRSWSVLTGPHFFLHSDGNLCIFCSFPPTTVPFFSPPPSSDRPAGCALTKHQPSALTPLRCPGVVCGSLWTNRSQLGTDGIPKLAPEMTFLSLEMYVPLIHLDLLSCEAKDGKTCIHTSVLSLA